MPWDAAPKWPMWGDPKLTIAHVRPRLICLSAVAPESREVWIGGTQTNFVTKGPYKGSDGACKKGTMIMILRLLPPPQPNVERYTHTYRISLIVVSYCCFRRLSLS